MPTPMIFADIFVDDSICTSANSNHFFGSSVYKRFRLNWIVNQQKVNGNGTDIMFSLVNKLVSQAMKVNAIWLED